MQEDWSISTAIAADKKETQHSPLPSSTNKQTNKTVAQISQPPAEAKPLVGVSIVSAFQIINCRLGSSWMIYSWGRWLVYEGRLDEYIIWFALHGWISATHPQIDASPLIIWWMTLNPKPGRSLIRSFNSSFARRLLCLLRSQRWRLIEFCFAEEDLLWKGSVVIPGRWMILLAYLKFCEWVLLLCVCSGCRFCSKTICSPPLLQRDLQLFAKEK